MKGGMSNMDGKDWSDCVRRRITTKAQRKAIKRLYDRGGQDQELSYLQFRREKYYGWCDVSILFNFFNMVVGIEPDGYTHS